jgi:hypothetical protein
MVAFYRELDVYQDEMPVTATLCCTWFATPAIVK